MKKAKLPRRQSKRKRNAVLIFVVSFVIVVSMLYMVMYMRWMVSSDADRLALDKLSFFAPRSADMQSPSGTSNLIQPIYLKSRNAILIALNESRTVMLDVSSEERVYPASLTKIMTAVIALEKILDYDETMMLERRMIDEAIVQDLATAGFILGENVVIKDMLYGLMLPSGAECAIGLAQYVAGSERVFADLMNRKAAELGMTQTHFTNATGAHDPRHYSTVRDIATLLDYALTNSLFLDIFTSHQYFVGPTNMHPEGFFFSSTMFSKTSGIYNKFRLLGGKTGYTTEAGQCLASLAEKDGKLYILVTAGAPARSNLTESLHIDDAEAVFSTLGERAIRR